MANQRDRETQVQALVAQDQGIDESRLNDFHAQLKSSLESWERRGAKLRRIAMIAVLVFLVTAILTPGMVGSLRSAEGAGRIVLPLWLAISWGSLVTTVGTSGWYFSKYVPAMRRLRFDIQTSMIAELQEQVAELRRELEDRKESS